MNGQAGSLQLQKVGGQRVRFTFSGSFKTPGFEINDVGYVRRADDITQSGWVQIRWDKPTKAYRRFRLNLNQWSGWNFGGDHRYAGTNVNAHIVLNSNWAAGGGRQPRGGGHRRPVDARRPVVPVEARRQRLVLRRRPTAGRRSTARGRASTSATRPARRPTASTRRSAGAPTSYLTRERRRALREENEDTQWVQNVEGPSKTHYVFGRIRQTTVGLTARVNYTITPTLTVQIYAQPFVSAGEYSDYKELTAPRAQPYAAQFSPYPYPGNPDFNYRSFRIDQRAALGVPARARRSTSCGSRGARTCPSTAVSASTRTCGNLFGTPANNVFLVKFSYWLNM